MGEEGVERGVPPYVSGGGGFVLEQMYAATLLSRLLADGSAVELGDGSEIRGVRFQGRPESPVDDLVVSGSVRGQERRVAIGVRRKVSLVPSHGRTVELLASYVRMTAERQDEIEARRLRLCLAVAVENQHVQDLRRLVKAAAEADGEAAFRAGLEGKRRRGSLGWRLAHVDEMVASAVLLTGSAATAIDAKTLTWRVLRYLVVRSLRLEDDRTDRTHAVEILRPLTEEQTSAAGDNLFARIYELAGRYARDGAEVTAVRLREDLGMFAVPARQQSEPRSGISRQSSEARMAARSGAQHSRPHSADDNVLANLTSRDLLVPTPENISVGSWPISELADPFALEVHHAIEAGSVIDLPALPTYVKREHDRLLNKAVAGAISGASQIKVLVGSSSTGKTRACWEALSLLRECREPWRLWHPIDPSYSDAALAGLPQIGPRTVVWLNEIQHYLLTPGRETGERIAAGLRELLRDPARGPVLVLGTIWPEYWTVLTTAVPPNQPDPHAQARELLTSSGISVPDAFSGTALDDLKATAGGDPRLAAAIIHAENNEVAQFLAGSPVLLERYRNAPPAARALIEAAMDARRLGHGPAMPLAMLETASPGYLTDSRWDALEQDWLEQALAYATAPCRGIRGPLTRIRPRPGDLAPACPHYRLADYLEQDGRTDRWPRPVPAALWDALAAFASDDSLPALVEASQRRGLYRCASRMASRAAERGADWAMRRLADDAERVRDPACAAAWLRTAAGTGDRHAMARLAHAALGKDQEEAERWLTAAVEAGDEFALNHLVELLDQAGRQPEAERLLRSSAAEGNGAALMILVRRLTRAGEDEQGRALLREAAVNGNSSARSILACRLVRDGQAEEAETLLPFPADYDLYDLVKELFSAGRYAEAESWLHRLVREGDINAQYILVRSLDWAGRHVEAEAWLRSIAESDRPEALSELADRLDSEGRADEAEIFHRQSVRIEHEKRDQSLYWLSMRLADQGRQDEARHYRQQAIDSFNHSWFGLLRFPHWLAERFGDREVERVLQELTDRSNWDAAVFLAGRQMERGEYAEAEDALRSAAKAGNHLAMIALGELLDEHSNRHEEAESWLRLAIKEGGAATGLGSLAQLLENGDRRDEAQRLRRFGIEPDGTTADPWSPTGPLNSSTS